ncbi:MAG: glycosyltransferase [Saprospiraceae bacterium]|nr:glycosyltransferase [Saprospiraceae bacterium]
MRENSIIVFTKDSPALQGSGKTMRMMNWLAHLSLKYDRVYCVYFYSKGSFRGLKDQLPKNIDFLPIHLESAGRFKSYYRRVIAGIFWPKEYNFFWYETIKKEDEQTIRELIKKVDAILIYRLYLYPVLEKIASFTSQIKNNAIDMDDAESTTFEAIGRAQWRRRTYKNWFITTIVGYSMKYYEKHLPPGLATLYYAHPDDVHKYQLSYPNKTIKHFVNRVPYEDWREEKNITNNVLFAGTLNYYPNEEAIQLLVKDIWPQIVMQKKEATLTIAGGKPSLVMRKLIAASASITLIEDPVSINEIFQNAAILIVPLNIGGGTRIKILQAFSYGIPVVTTPIGVSGIEMSHNMTGMIADSVTDMVTSCLDLLNNESSRKRIAQNAYAYFIENYSFKIPEV